jgi:hypothetical protein
LKPIWDGQGQALKEGGGDVQPLILFPADATSRIRSNPFNRRSDDALIVTEQGQGHLFFRINERDVVSDSPALTLTFRLIRRRFEIWQDFSKSGHLSISSGMLTQLIALPFVEDDPLTGSNFVLRKRFGLPFASSAGPHTLTSIVMLPRQTTSLLSGSILGSMPRNFRRKSLRIRN